MNQHLPPLEIPIFEHLVTDQPSNLVLWESYMALRQSLIHGHDHAWQHQNMQQLRAARTTWTGRDEMALRRAIDAAMECA